MLNYRFNIDKYNWKVEVYYYITKYDVDSIISKLKYLNCKGKRLDKAIESITNNKLNTGLIYSNYSKRESLIIISKTSNPSEFINSFVHETYHLVSHICDSDNIDYLSEEAAYLMGDITQSMYIYSKPFICNHHDNKKNTVDWNIHRTDNNDS